MKVHLLYENLDFDFTADLPAQHEDLTRDLDLPVLLRAMAGDDHYLLDVARRVVLAGLAEPAEVLYRQAVLADCIAHPEVVRDLYAIAVAMVEEPTKLWWRVSKNPELILSSAVKYLEVALSRFKELRSIADQRSSEFESAGFKAFFRSVKTELDDEYLRVVKQHLRQLQFREGILISARLDRDNSSIDLVLRAPKEEPQGVLQYLGLGRRDAYSFTVPTRDEAGWQGLENLKHRAINLVANAAAQSADHILSYFATLRAELAFYLGCLRLRDQLVDKGVPITFPTPTPWRPARFAAKGLREVCLALRSEEPVVGNDAYANDRPLIIITGANSGGKSTFLRSIGLARLMLGCGMFVAAERLEASVLPGGVFTHFAREEDRSMTSGRLDEELTRMSVLADRLRPGSLVLFNESFASTNELEGSEIARQVVRALLEADIQVAFVTHQFDLADGFHRSDPGATLFLRAEPGPEGQRTYRLVEEPPLATSFGQDLYYRIGGWLDDAPLQATPPDGEAVGGAVGGSGG
jgi:DNA mismatch repair ATPase MutS